MNNHSQFIYNCVNNYKELLFITIPNINSIINLLKYFKKVADVTISHQD